MITILSASASSAAHVSTLKGAVASSFIATVVSHTVCSVVTTHLILSSNWNDLIQDQTCAAYMQKTSDAGDIITAIFLDFPPSLGIFR